MGQPENIKAAATAAAIAAATKMNASGKFPTPDVSSPQLAAMAEALAEAIFEKIAEKATSAGSPIVFAP